MPKDKVTIVFDLDSTVVDCCSGLDGLDVSENQRDIYLKSYPFVLEFHKRHLLVFASQNWYFIFPGFIELIRWLDKEGVEFAFFSLGIKERNMSLISQVLEIAFGSVKTRILLQKITIISREDISLYSYAKDLNYVCAKREKCVHNAILVDDNFGSMLHGQEGSFLHVLNATFPNYHAVHEKADVTWIEERQRHYFAVQNSLFVTQQLFYATGLIAKSIEDFEKGLNDSLSRVLSSKLYLENGFLFYDIRSGMSAEAVRKKRYNYIRYGLSILKTVNSTLELPAIGSIFDKNYSLAAPRSVLPIELSRCPRLPFSVGSSTNSFFLRPNPKLAVTGSQSDEQDVRLKRVGSQEVFDL